MCCGHLIDDQIMLNGETLLDRIEQDVCVCCGHGDESLIREYIAERVWVCHGFKDQRSGSCCYGTIDTMSYAVAGTDHSVSHRDLILASLDKELRAKEFG